MIIQKVIRGINGISESEADEMFIKGIMCNWWRRINLLPQVEIADRLTETNLHWHQNRYIEIDTDPIYGGRPFCENTPFISTTAGCVERDEILLTNVQYRAWFEALRFATNFWQSDGFLFYCHLFVLGKQSIGYQQFAEEIRELNIFHNYSRYHPEGEVTAKIIIPGVQIEKWEFYDLATLQQIEQAGPLNAGHAHIPPTQSNVNFNYLKPETINNIRELI